MKKLKNDVDRFYNDKMALSLLLKEKGLETMSNDFEVVDRIFNLLTENKSIDKIEGIISNIEIVKYGGGISDIEATSIYNDILDWWT